MASPTPYNRTYSFNDFQSSNPSAPLPGVQVDNELENVELSLNEAIDAINDVRRSDGALKNGIVTLDTLDAQVQAGVGAGALASAAAAAASADAASDSAVAAAASATAADGSATAASGYASNALTSRNEASGFSDDATAMAVAAAGYRDFAAAWATAAEGVDVDDGVNPVGKSSYHWAQVALGAATGALPDGAVTLQKVAPEVLDSVNHSYDGTASGLSAETVQNAIDEMDGAVMRTGTPFGRAGMRVLKGLENDAHYGFNSYIFDIGSGKWTIVYRKASNHTVVNGSEIRAADTYDKGATLENDRLIYTDTNTDTRNFVARVMGNGRLGILASRRQAAPSLAYQNPVFLYSDDAGVSWTAQVITANTPGQAVNFHAYMIDYPASVGGNDTLGFIGYSYGSANPDANVDALYTVDNGATWTWNMAVATSILSITEVSVSRIGTQDKWIMLGRPAGDIGDPGRVWVSDDPLNFGTDGTAGVELTGNPPLTIYDAATNLFWYLCFVRRDRPLMSGTGAGEANLLVVASADADALYAAGGNMTTLGVNWAVLSRIPDWASGYMHPALIDGKWYATFVCGEEYPGHNYSKMCLIGDFVPTGADRANFEWMFASAAVQESRGRLGSPGSAATEDLTIVSGVITVTRPYHYIDTEGDAATDDLTTINGGEVGDLLVLQTATSSRDVTVKNAIGNIRCGSDRVLTRPADKIMFIKTASEWAMLSFADNET